MYGAGSRYVERSRAERAAIRGGGDGKVTFPYEFESLRTALPGGRHVCGS